MSSLFQLNRRAIPLLGCAENALKGRGVNCAPVLGMGMRGGVVGRRWKSGPYGYTQAKALVYSKYGEPGEVLSLHQHSISPSLPSSTMLLRTLAAPLNPADINQIQGVYPSKPPLTSLLGTQQPSAVPGNEACFEVVSTGSDIKDVKKGDWVIMRNTNFGTWRTHALAEEKDILKVEERFREGLSATQVATVGVNPVTAWMLLRGFVDVERDGGWWLQNGANGGVGRAALQLGKMWGAKSINVIRDRESEEETEKLRNELLDLGATKVVTEKELMDRGFRQQVKEWTGGKPVRLALNCVGGKATSALTACLTEGATVVTYGGMAKKPLEVGAGALIFKDISYKGFWVSRWSKENVEEKKRVVEELLEMMRKGELRDTPMQECRWSWETEEEELKGVVRGTLEGFRKGKGVFVFVDT